MNEKKIYVEMGEGRDRLLGCDDCVLGFDSYTINYRKGAVRR